MPRFLHRTLDAFARFFGWVPVSTLGLLCLLLLPAAWVGYAWPREDHVARVTIILVALALLASAASATWAALRLRRWLGREAREVTVQGQAERGPHRGIDVPAFGWWAGVRISTEWVTPRAVRTQARRVPGAWREELIAERRCAADRVQRRFAVETVFGLGRIDFTSETRAAVRIRPWTGPGLDLSRLISWVDGSELSNPLGRAVGDRVDMRPYAPGDPPRLLLWKLYARTGELLVRTPERAGDPEQRWAVFLVNHPDDEAAAGVADLLLRSGALGTAFWFGADGSPEPIDDLDTALDVVTASSAYEGASGAGLGGFLLRARALGANRALVLAPPARGLWLEASGPIDLHTWICVDGIHDGPESWLLDPVPMPGIRPPRAEVEALLASSPTASLVDRRRGALPSTREARAA